MLEVKSVWRFLFNLKSRREEMSKPKLQNRGLAFEVVAPKVGGDVALGIEDWGRVSVRTAPASSVVGGVGPFVPSSGGRGARIVSKRRKGRQRR